MNKYRDIIFGISVWVESHNRLTFRDEETKATRLLTTDELEEIISKYEALEKYIADVEKNTHMGYDIREREIKDVNIKRGKKSKTRSSAEKS